MDNWRENWSIISRLKVAGKPADALSSRLFFERLVGGANFHPPGIPTRAVICIRKLSAPPLFNGRLPVGGGNPALEWEQLIRREVEQLSRRAFRPLRQIVPLQAESVIFDDKAELLACLAQDWTRGALAEHWWWRALFPNLFGTQTPFKIWLETAELAPAALQVLSGHGAAENFVRKLETAQALELLGEVIRIFGLDRLSAAFPQAPETIVPPASGSIVKWPASTSIGAGKTQPSAMRSDAFFARLVPESKAAELSAGQRVLLETGLLLARSPRAARSAEFAERVRAVWAKNEARLAVADRQPVAASGIKKAPAKNAAPRRSNPAASRNRFEPPVSAPPARAGRPATGAPRKAAHNVSAPLKTAGGRQKKRRSTDESLSKPTKREPPKPSAAGRFEPARAEHKPAAPPPKATRAKTGLTGRTPTEEVFKNVFEPLETGVELDFETRFGGLFYLLNLGLYLGLYRDFTEQLTTELDLNIWDFVALLGLEFLGEPMKTDAVWSFLRRAAELENDDHFGREFDRSQDWRVPTAWLETFPDDRMWVWSKSRSRLVVRHADGFNVIDVPARGAAGARLAAELAVYEGFYARIERAGREHRAAASARHWLQNLAAYLRQRLYRALGVQTPAELNALLFERRARVSVSPTHLEVAFALADLPLEVRLAGIDRNPAWIPAAGKFVYFHFV